MSWAQKIWNRFLSKLENRIIYRRDGKPYLVRYYILHSNKYKFLPGIYIHHFLSSDEDLELHDHPWLTSLSFILSGSYMEERREFDNTVSTKRYQAGMFNLIKANDFHRVDLETPSVWTLFLSGNRSESWGFWDRDTGKYTSWRRHVSKYLDIP